MENFIKVQDATFLENFTDGVVYLPEVLEKDIFERGSIEKINELLQEAGRGTVEENITPFFKSLGLTLEETAKKYNDYMVGEDPEDFEDLEEFEDECIINFEDVRDYEPGQLIDNMFYYMEQEGYSNLADKFIDFLDLQTFTVGYSQWATAVTYKGDGREFYQDLWDGYNFYDLSLHNAEGELLDSVGGFYLRSTADLQEAVESYFGLTEFKLIDNMEADNFEIEKAETITMYK